MELEFHNNDEIWPFNCPWTLWLSNGSIKEGGGGGGGGTLPCLEPLPYPALHLNRAPRLSSDLNPEPPGPPVLFPSRATSPCCRARVTIDSEPSSTDASSALCRCLSPLPPQPSPGLPHPCAHNTPLPLLASALHLLELCSAPAVRLDHRHGPYPRWLSLQAQG